MIRLARCGLLAALLAQATPVSAHPVPFSYLDLRLVPGAVEVALVVHAYDLSHDLGLGVESPERLLEAGVLDAQSTRAAAILRDRLQLSAGGQPIVSGPWSAPEPLPERQSVRFRARYETDSTPGSLMVAAVLFPYDPQHQTFLNFYEGEELTSQAILGGERYSFEYFTGTRQGAFAVMQKFVPAGVHHILIGPDHLLFLVGLLLLGGSIRRLLLVVTAFTAAHSITLSLAALNIFSPPAQIIEPAIALSIVYVGADNLMVRGGRDVRAWIAFAFGFIHGFGFANVLREMDLPRQALGWSLFSFNIGVEIGQVLVVAIVAAALLTLRARSETAGRWVAVAGSVLVIAAGAYWFVQRVFFPGGMA